MITISIYTLAVSKSWDNNMIIIIQFLKVLCQQYWILFSSHSFMYFLQRIWEILRPVKPTKRLVRDRIIVSNKVIERPNKAIIGIPLWCRQLVRGGFSSLFSQISSGSCSHYPRLIDIKPRCNDPGPAIPTSQRDSTDFFECIACLLGEHIRRIL